MLANRLAGKAALGLTIWLAIGAVRAAEVPLAEILEEIGKQAAQVSSYQADLTMGISVMGQAMTSKGRMILRKPDRTYTEMETDMGVMKMKQIMVSDGKWMWMHQPAMNMITKIDMAKLAAATKGAPGAAPAATGGADLTKPLLMFDQATVKLLRTDTLEGTDVYVFEGEMPKGAVGAPQMQIPFLPAKMQAWVSAGDGLLRKMVMLDKEGKETMTQTYSNIVLNKDYPDSQFQFTPPAGAQVMDMTEGALNMMKQATGGGQAAPAAPAKAQ